MATPFLSSPLEPTWTQLGATMAQLDGGWRVPASFAGSELELRVARQAVVLGDDTARGKIRLQGEVVAQVVRQTLGDAPDEVGMVAHAGAAEISRLRPDLCHVGTPAEAHVETLAALRSTSRDMPITITDVTHGRFELRLVGPAAPTLLSKVCGLDFDADVFSADQARETSVAKTYQLLIRVDAGELPAYRLLGGRALGAYVWETLMVAGRDLGIAPIGHAALQILHG
jgi:heterotetrameric sarcosine oxidase gamma subunit